MNKKVVTGAVIALAAGIAAYIYNRRRNKLDAVAEDSYNKMNDILERTESATENIFS